MRLQARKPIALRGKALGGQTPLICIPIVAEGLIELEESANKIYELDPDVIEWRADYYKDICDIKKVKEALKSVRRIIKSIPLIFTLRSSMEGGYKEVDEVIRFEVIKQAIYTGELDAIDIELISGAKNIKKIKEVAIKRNIPLILSYHNFKETPSVDFLVNKMKDEILNGADIAKIAVMANKEEDVLNLLLATLKMRREILDTPLITMSMGKLGVTSRIVGGLFGSDLTFGANEKISAPGQMPAIKLKLITKILYEEDYYESFRNQ